MGNTEGPDYGKWLIAALCVAVIASEIVVIRQNRQLRQHVVAVDASAKQLNFLRSQSDRTLFESSMTGRCTPFAGDRSASASTAPLEVSIYFSLERDCMSCVEDVVGQWNGALRNPIAKSLVVKGYTEIDGTRARTLLDRDLKPAFPITNVPDIEQKLATSGIPTTPVVFVSDPTTGRILMTYAPRVGEKGDRSLLERLHNVLTPCA